MLARQVCENLVYELMQKYDMEFSDADRLVGRYYNNRSDSEDDQLVDSCVHRFCECDCKRVILL